MTLWGFGAVGAEEGVTNTGIGMNQTLWAGTYPGLTRPMLGFLAEPTREYLAEAGR